jgi:hypothetical protein
VNEEIKLIREIGVQCSYHCFLVVGNLNIRKNFRMFDNQETKAKEAAD